MADEGLLNQLEAQKSVIDEPMETNASAVGDLQFAAHSPEGSVGSDGKFSENLIF